MTQMELMLGKVLLLVLIAYYGWLFTKATIIAFELDLRKIPGPWLSRFTNIPLKFQVLAGKRDSYINHLHQKYGPFVRVAPREVSVADITAYHEINKIGTTFNKGPWYQQLSPYQTSDDTCAVFAIRDQRKAAARRKFFLQAGAPVVVREWEPQVAEIVDLTVAKIKRDLLETGVADVMKWWKFMTADVLGLIAFGESFNMVEKEQKSQIIKDIETIFISVGIRLELPWLWYFIQFSRLPILDLAGVTERFQGYAETAIKNTKLAAKGLTKTLFSKMIGVDTQALSDSVIRQEAVNIIIAGTDTTAMTLTYLVYSVLADETGAVRKRLLEELSTCSQNPTWIELENKTYLNQVLNEALRRYCPVGGSLTRVPPDGGAVLGGYKMPAGTVVMTQAVTFHTDPAVFQDPLRFDPDRWQSPSPQMKHYFMPFGGSARSCLGQNIAKLEVLRATARLFQQCPNIKLAPSTTSKSMSPFELFVIKPVGGKCEIQLV